jgi:cellulose synthase/poly-beta-1,6-N-acetylglucosamine synthase-like glycosyltransferase
MRGGYPANTGIIRGGGTNGGSYGWSTDATADVVQRIDDNRVRLLNLPGNRGKAAAITVGCQIATGQIIVFADARQRWARDALPLLLENFAAPEVGAVSGELVLEDAGGVLAGVGFYWRYEKWLRHNQSAAASTVGVTGSICAVRRELFAPIPRGTLLDDVYWPMCLVMRGYRVVHDKRAVAFDRLPERPGNEFRRKVRTLAGNFQLVARLPSLLSPFHNPLWFSFISHKLLRLMAPWAMLAMLLTGALLDGVLYRAALLAQVAFMVVALIGICGGRSLRWRFASVAAAVLVLNAAAFAAFWVWISGNTHRAWKKISYAPVRPNIGLPS